eukprot:SAG31_NODE_1838_length_7128_cov_4.274125_3_plen_139_part_00
MNHRRSPGTGMADVCGTCSAGPMFEFYNNVLRAKGKEIPFGWQYPGEKGRVTTGRFVTTIHAINSGIVKLSTLTPTLTVYRGMSGLPLPGELESADKFGSRLGIEYGELSRGQESICKGLSMRCCRFHVYNGGQGRCD